MISASKLAGFFAAHAIWCVSDGETLIPMLAYTTADDERKVDRLVSDTVAASVADRKSLAGLAAVLPVKRQPAPPRLLRAARAALGS